MKDTEISAQYSQVTRMLDSGVYPSHKVVLLKEFKQRLEERMGTSNIRNAQTQFDALRRAGVRRPRVR